MSKTMWEYTPVTVSLEPLTKAQMLISTQPREKNNTTVGKPDYVSILHSLQ